MKDNQLVLSSSFIRQWVVDANEFRRTRLLCESDKLPVPAMIMGTAYHKIMEMFYSTDLTVRRDFDWDLALKSQTEWMINEVNEGRVNMGKTGDLDDCIRLLGQLVDFYKDELPEYAYEATVLMIEKYHKIDIFDYITGAPLFPLQGTTDLVLSWKNQIVIIDHKSVAVFNKDETPKFDIQGCGYEKIVSSLLGRPVDKMIFEQVKKTKNKDGSPQRFAYTVVFNDTIRKRYNEFYRRVCYGISGIPLRDENGYVLSAPNVYADYGWQTSWEFFCREVDNLEN